MKKRRKYMVYISLHHTISFIQKKKKTQQNSVHRGKNEVSLSFPSILFSLAAGRERRTNGLQ